MAATLWYVYDNWWPCRRRGTVTATTIDGALNIARARWGHHVAVQDLPFRERAA